LYFKVDDTTKPDYEDHGSSPFVYEMPNGKEMAMSYWQLPEEVMEDSQELEQWVAKAVEASLRSKAKKKR
jgi:DNA transformation protein and related proteins